MNIQMRFNELSWPNRIVLVAGLLLAPLSLVTERFCFARRRWRNNRALFSVSGIVRGMYPVHGNLRSACDDLLLDRWI
jgi:hypothetical protein